MKKTISRRLGVVLLLAALPAPAAEVVYLSSGSTMVVDSHTVEDGMIRLDLGPEATIAFPLELVERIEPAGPDVRCTIRSNVAASNAKRVPSPAKHARDAKSWQKVTVRSPGAPPAVLDNRQPTERIPPQTGMATDYPQADHPNQAARKVGVVGRVDRPGNGSGVRRVGTAWVVDGAGHEPRRGTTPQLRAPRRR